MIDKLDTFGFTIITDPDSKELVNILNKEVATMMFEKINLLVEEVNRLKNQATAGTPTIIEGELSGPTYRSVDKAILETLLDLRDTANEIKETLYNIEKQGM